MPPARESREEAVQRARNLDALVVRVAQGKHWADRRQQALRILSAYLDGLIAHIVQADGSLAREEFALIQQYYRHDLPWEEEDDWSRGVRSANPGLPSSIPEFFEAACHHDDAEGTTLAAQMLAEIEAFCLCIAQADGVAAPSERRVLELVAHALGGRLALLRAAAPAESP